MSKQNENEREYYVECINKKCDLYHAVVVAPVDSPCDGCGKPRIASQIEPD